MTKNRYRLIDYYQNLDDNDGWESIVIPQIQWLIKQNKTRYVVEEMYAYEYDNASIPMRASVYVSFYDERLETEFLLKFSHLA